MCGIAGFSLVEGSKVNSRALANALLTEIESRGTDASGWAYTTREGKEGMFKAAVPGSQLSLKGMPRKADTVILHSRFATQGHQSNNNNNHPLKSPNGTVRLVHNGVIANDFELKHMLTGTFPEVDSSVIPAMIEEYTVEGLSLVAGYAALAWLDSSTGNTLHLARPDTSPVNIARLLDGSIVFASTEALLARSLKLAGLQWIGQYPSTFAELDDGDYIQVTNGQIEQQEAVGWFDDYRYTWSPAMAASQSGTWTPASEENEYFDAAGNWIGDSADDWNAYNSGVHSSMALTSGTGATKDAKFYIMDHDRDYVDFDTLANLVDYLIFSGNQVPEALTADKDIAWINAVLDVGEVTEDGSLNSWVLNPEQIDAYDIAIDGGLQFVTDGAQILRNVLTS